MFLFFKKLLTFKNQKSKIKNLLIIFSNIKSFQGNNKNTDRNNVMEQSTHSKTY